MQSLLRLLLISVLAAGACRAQNAPPALLKSSDLQADAALLKRAYEQLHPGLYRYNSKAEIGSDFAALNRQLDHDQSLQDAFVAFSEFAAKVQCGHTQANPFNQSKSVVETLFKSPTRLPFYFDWLDGRMIVTRDFTPDHKLPAGTEVVELNGVTPSKILTRLLSIARADGANNAKRVAQLAVNGDSEYETFDIYYPLLFPQKDAKAALTVRKPDSKKTEHISAGSCESSDKRVVTMAFERMHRMRAVFEHLFNPQNNKNEHIDAFIAALGRAARGAVYR